jgi:Arginyl tRNA synthetase N terminal domain
VNIKRQKKQDKTTMADDAKGPSKNELKKLAKKAEKAAKKQSSKGGEGGGDANKAPAAAKGGPPVAEKAAAPVVAAAPLPPSPKVLLYQASENDPATIKAVWAALQFNVDVGVAKRNDLPVGCNKSTKKPVLIYGSNDYVLGGGGNAMCKAISLMGGQPLSYEADELCEMERTTLRVADGTKLKLDALAVALEHSATGIHLVGSSDSIADICIIVSLSKYAKDHLDSWPTSVQKYYKCHIAALERAHAAVPKYLPAPPVDMNDPSMLKLLRFVFASVFEELVPGADLPAAIIKRCDNPKFGDFQCSAAMPVFSGLKKSGQPMPPGISGPPQLAQAVIDSLGTNHPVVQELRLQGPGFIMFKISPSYLQGQAQSILDQKSLSKPKINPITCLVDFSSPNIASKCCLHVEWTNRFELSCNISSPPN